MKYLHVGGETREAEGTDLSRCAACGMGCLPGEYHPHIACLAFKQCRDSRTVTANLLAAVDFSRALPSEGVDDG